MSRYNWDCILSVGEDEANTKKIWKKIPREFTKFSKDKKLSGMKDTERFAFRKVHTTPLPLNNFLLDEACLLMLRRMTSTVTLDEVKKEEELLTDFFGTVNKGCKALDNLDEDDWEDLLAY